MEYKQAIKFDKFKLDDDIVEFLKKVSEPTIPKNCTVQSINILDQPYIMHVVAIVFTRWRDKNGKIMGSKLIIRRPDLDDSRYVELFQVLTGKRLIIPN